MATECPICVTNMNKSTRSPICCPDPACGFVCCRSCVQEYIVTQRNDPKCMNCSKAFSRLFLQEVMPATWIAKTYTTERRNILFERERSMIPDTMPYVEAETTAKRMTSELQELAALQKELKRRQREIEEEMRGRTMVIHRLRNGEIEKKGASGFIVKCPECPGFVDKKGKCSGCGTRICIHCKDILVLAEGAAGTVDDIVVHTSVEEGSEILDRYIDADGHQHHVCKPDTLATAKMIEQDTRPCPKCGNRIHKIEGCDQMFDPHCGTAFSWKTGQIVTGVIHNPHYFEWQRQNGGRVARTPGDVPCGGPPDQAEMMRFIGYLPDVANFNRAISATRRQSDTPDWCKIMSNRPDGIDPIKDICMRFHIVSAARLVTHIQHVTLPELQSVWDASTNRKQRIQFIQKEITEEEFKKHLAQKEKHVEKAREIEHILNTYVHAVSDILRMFVGRFANVDYRNLSNDSVESCMPLYEMFGVNETNFKNLLNWVRFFPTTPAATGNPGAWDTAKIMYNGRWTHFNTFIVPDRKVVFGTYTELKNLETYCNEQFAKISRSWKNGTPRISMGENKVIHNHTWYKK